MNKQRLVYIDVLRAFAIILVVMGHLLETSGTDNKTLYGIIYCFHMPLFMCISGFVTVYSTSIEYEQISWRARIADTGRYIRKKFNHIIIPYLAWTCLVLPFFFSTPCPIPDYATIFRKLFITNGSYWFLPCLFGLSVCFAFYRLGRSWCTRDSVWLNLAILGGIACALVAVYHITKWDLLRSVISYFLPFFIGVLMGQYPSFYRYITNSRNLYTFALFLIPLIAGFYFHDKDTSCGKLARLICGCASIPFCFFWFKNREWSPQLASFFSYIGRNTLIIYILHGGGIPHCDLSIYHIPAYIKLVLYPAWSLLIILPILGINLILEQSTLARRLLLGRK